MDAPRTVGVEEELLLVDPETRATTARAAEVLKKDRERGDGLDKELFRHQIETRTEPETSLDAIEKQLVAWRREAAEVAGEVGLAVVASGTAPIGGEPHVSDDDRYRDMVDYFGETARTGTTCGCHVHVAIESAEEGVGVIDRIVPWLPVLLAVSANSPYWAARDTGYASWRSQAWTRWPSAGSTEAFGSVERYAETSRMLQMTGAARDDGMLYYDARLSTKQPTVEVRVLDVCADVDDAVLAASLVRGLVETAAEEWAADKPHEPWRAEILRACSWRAGRWGLAGTLVHPLQRDLAPARDVLGALVAYVRPSLERAGELERVQDGVERVLRGGGATRQRAAYERSGSVEGVVDDLIARTQAQPH